MKFFFKFLFISLLFLIIPNQFAYTLTDYESLEGHPKECEFVNVDQMIPGECKWLPTTISSIGGRCTKPGVRTFCDYIHIGTSEFGSPWKHVLCDKPDPSCDFVDKTLTCPTITANSLTGTWGWYEAPVFNSIKDLAVVTKKYNVGVWYIDAYKHRPKYDYKELRAAGAIIIPVATDTDQDESQPPCTLTQHFKDLISNPYTSGIILNIEGDMPTCKSEINIKIIADAVHDAGKIFLITNNPGELRNIDQPSLGLATIYNKYVDFLLPYMYYWTREQMTLEYPQQQAIFSRGPIGILGPIGYTEGNDRISPTLAATLPNYVKNNIFSPKIGNSGHYGIFGGSNFYYCAQGVYCLTNDSYQPIYPVNSLDYLNLLNNLKTEYPTQRTCTMLTSRTCTDADWSAITLRDDCSTNPTSGKKIFFWKRLNECYGGVEHEIEETTTCTNTCMDINWNYTDGECQNNNKLIRTYTTKIGNCNGNAPSPKEIDCNYAPNCIESDWSYIDGECQSNNKLIRTYTIKTKNCTGSIPTQKEVSCIFVPECSENNWVPSDSNCQPNGTLIRTWKKIGNCNKGVTKPLTEEKQCTYQAPQCIYEYSEWSACSIYNEKIRSANPINTPCNGTPQTTIELCLSECTLDNYNYIIEPTTCPTQGYQTKNYYKIRDCINGVIQPSNEIIYCDNNIIQVNIIDKNNDSIDNNIQVDNNIASTINPYPPINPVTKDTNQNQSQNLDQNNKLLVQNCSGTKCAETCYNENGICCNNNWNKNLDSCEYNYDYEISIVNSNGDEEATQLINSALEFAEQGNLIKSKSYKDLAILRTKIVLQNNPSELIEKYEQAKLALNENNFEKVELIIQEIENKGSSFKDVYPIAILIVVIILFIIIYLKVIKPKLTNPEKNNQNYKTNYDEQQNY